MRFVRGVRAGGRGEAASSLQPVHGDQGEVYVLVSSKVDPNLYWCVFIACVRGRFYEEPPELSWVLCEPSVTPMDSS